MAVSETNHLSNQFEDMWDEAERDFHEKTGRKLRGTGNPGDPKDLTEQFLDKLKHQDAVETDGSRRKQSARDVVGHVVEFVQTVGSFVGLGLSVAFGAPAEMCVNAFQFLIDIPNKLEAIRDNLIQLFEEMSSVLLEFQVLDKIPANIHVDEELLTIYHKMLIAFVSICAQHIERFESGRLRRLKIKTKQVALQNDSGIKKDLDNFRHLAERQARILVTAGYKDQKIMGDDVNVMKRDIGYMTTTLRDNQIPVELKRKMQPIAELLRVGPDTPNRHLQKLSDRYDKVFDEVCQWAYQTEEYKEWIDQGSKQHLLCIAGDEKTGKTSLLAAISRKLKTPVHTGNSPNPNPIVLYYDFALTSDSESSSNQDYDPVEIALKVLAFQRAQSSLKHATFLEDAMLQIQPLDRKSILKLLSNLLSLVDQETYILLNGLHRLDGNSRFKLLELLCDLKDSRNGWAKILVVGLDSFFQGVKDSALVLNVKDHNEPGVRWYVENEIRQTGILQGNNNEITIVREGLVERLPDQVGRNFVAMQQKLNQVKIAIKHERTVKEVLAILDGDFDAASEEKWITLTGSLQENLKADDIENLNLILARLAYGYGEYWPTVEELDAILLLHGRRRPVLALKERLKEKYSDILVIHPKFVALHEGFESFLRSGRVRSRSSSADQSKISVKIEIDRADRRSVKQILWDLNDGFDFDDPKLADYKSDLHRIEIGVDAAKAHFFMLETCLQYFNEDKNPHTEAFKSYSHNIFSHLNEWQKLEPAAEDLKAICQKLINFFEDTSVLEDKWSLSDTEIDRWISADTLKIIEDVFKAAKKSAKFEPRDKRWIEKKVNLEANRGDIWLPITLLVARNWLQDRQWQAGLCYRWIHSLIELQSKPTRQDRGDTEDPTKNIKNLSLDEEILRAADWCVGRLNIDTSSALYYERLASAFLQYERVDVAEKLIEKADGLSEPHWRTQKELGCAYAKLGRHTDAIEQLNMAVQQLQSSDEDQGQQRELVDVLFDLAQSQQKGSDTEAALQSYEQLLELDPFRDGREPLLDPCFKESFKLLPIDDNARAKDLICGKEQKFIGNIDDLQRRLEAAYGHYPADTAASYWLVVVMQEEEIAHRIENALELICEKKRSEKNTNIPAHWFYISGIVFCRSKHPGLYEKGLICLEECVSYAGKHADEPITDLFAVYPSIVSRKAHRQLCTWESFSISSMEPSHEDFTSEWERFESFIKTARRSFEFQDMSAGKSPLTFLCRYYVLHGMHEKARDLMRQDVQEGLLILDDNDPDNDTDGFKLLAEAFKCVGDDIGALTAWSQMVPTDLGDESQKNSNSANTGDRNGKDAERDSNLEHPTHRDEDHRPGNLNYICDGTCEKRWYYADDLWSCKHCFDIQFCSDCHESLKKGQLRRIICHPEHEFLHVPRWSDAEYFTVGKQHLRVDGELDHDGRMVNGSIISFEEWLDRIRRDWSL